VDDRKDELRLRIIAARFISSDEQIGLAELERITADASRLIRKRYWLWFASLVATATATAVTLLLAIALTWEKEPVADIVTLVGLICFGTMLAVGASWRAFQYGGVKAAAPQKPVYANPEDPAVRNLERLFAMLQLESSPRAFYLSRDGTRRHIDHRYFFGKLRAAYVARDAPLCPKQEWGIEARELRAAYRRALLALPRRTRRIFLMHRLKGMSYREISEKLGVGDKGVEYHMMRALDRCRRAAARLD